MFCKTLFGCLVLRNTFYVLFDAYDVIWAKSGLNNWRFYFPYIVVLLVCFFFFNSLYVCNLRFSFRVKQICQTIQLLPGVTYWFKSVPLFYAYNPTSSKIHASNNIFKYLKTVLIFIAIEFYIVLALIKVYVQLDQIMLLSLYFFLAIFQIIIDIYVWCM